MFEQTHDLTVVAMLFLIVMVVGTYLIHVTRFGRNVYTRDSSDTGAMVPCVPIGRTTIAV